MKKKLSFLLSFGLLAGLVFISGCGDDDDAPPIENEEEVVDLVKLTFIPAGGGTNIVVEANDPDGEGPEDFITPKISLDPNTIYTLNLEVRNTEEGEDITQEIKEEGLEHQFFYGWTGALFQNPTGLGNIGAGNQGNIVQYEDEDEAGLPIGLSTLWETSEASVSGTFRLLLKHQPDIKSETSSSEDGESDIDLTFPIEII